MNKEYYKKYISLKASPAASISKHCFYPPIYLVANVEVVLKMNVINLG